MLLTMNPLQSCAPHLSAFSRGVALVCALTPAGCQGDSSPTTTEDSAPTTTGSATSSTTDALTTTTTTGWITTSSGGVPWIHECPEGSTTSYNEAPYDPGPCQYEDSPNAYDFCSCRYHELCVDGLDLFFPSGMSGWYTAGVCAAPCTTDADCPATAPGGTAVPECREVDGEKWCVLDCSDGKTCGEGICSEPPLEVCVGTYVP